MAQKRIVGQNAKEIVGYFLLVLFTIGLWVFGLTIFALTPETIFIETTEEELTSAMQNSTVLDSESTAEIKEELLSIFASRKGFYPDEFYDPMNQIYFFLQKGQPDDDFEHTFGEYGMLVFYRLGAPCDLPCVDENGIIIYDEDGKIVLDEDSSRLYSSYIYDDFATPELKNMVAKLLQKDDQ